MWDGNLEEIHAMNHRIELNEIVRPFQSASFQEGPKTRVLEKSEVLKQQKDGVIEHAQSKWVEPALIEPKKNRQTRFCVG